MPCGIASTGLCWHQGPGRPVSLSLLSLSRRQRLILDPRTTRSSAPCPTSFGLVIPKWRSIWCFRPVERGRISGTGNRGTEGPGLRAVSEMRSGLSVWVFTVRLYLVPLLPGHKVETIIKRQLRSHKLPQGLWASYNGSFQDGKRMGRNIDLTRCC